ncbi:ExeA family protein [Ideonella sp. A 288]|uniref:ExeA family protein n=1 Tax=Ideonella sp. A 288 TaxID=1962181 RepID=UPI000B4B278B|nr:ExeA family protein [Ideonella sp. A 288]
MYLRFHGLDRPPFSIAPDPRFLYLSERHREALAHLRYGVGSGGGVVVLTGEIGSGKTTVCRSLLEQVPEQCHLAYLFNPRLSVRELLQSVNAEFGLLVPDDAQRPASIKDHVDALNGFLLAAHAAGRHCVLIVDEAQRLSLALLEQLRLLTNLETHEHKLLQIVLIGQPELRDKLARPELEQLSQRVLARFHLGPLSADETAQYVRHRLTVAGAGETLPFDAAALRRIHRHSRGVPRRINLLCDRALLGGYAEGRHDVGARIVDQAAREVFGPDGRGDARRPPGGRRAGVAAGLVLGGAALALGSAWVGSRWSGLATGKTSAAAPVPGPAADGQGLAAGAAASGSSLSPPLASAAPASQASQAVSVGLAIGPTSGPAPLPVPAAAALPLLDEAAFTAALDNAPRDESTAWRLLSRHWNASPPDGLPPCAALASQGLHCLKRAGSMAVLRGLGRPAILPLQGSDGAGRFVVLEGLSTATATVRIGERQVRVALPTLAAGWREAFGTLWREPPGTRFNADGVAVGVDEAWLAEQLRRARGEAGAASAAGVASQPPLRQQVQAFQRAQGLPADGQAGAMTIMHLQHAAHGGGPRLID